MRRTAGTSGFSLHCCLRQESSNSLSASADLYRRFGRVQCNLTLEGFYTDLRHVFALRKLATPDAAGNTVLERYNGGGATVAGANIEAACCVEHFKLVVYFGSGVEEAAGSHRAVDARKLSHT